MSAVLEALAKEFPVGARVKLPSWSDPGYGTVVDGSVPNSNRDVQRSDYVGGAILSTFNGLPHGPYINVERDDGDVGGWEPHSLTVVSLPTPPQPLWRVTRLNPSHDEAWTTTVGEWRAATAVEAIEAIDANEAIDADEPSIFLVNPGDVFHVEPVGKESHGTVFLVEPDGTVAPCGIEQMLPTDVEEAPLRQRVVLLRNVPVGDDWIDLPRGTLLAVADADVVIASDGTVLKDRYLNTEVTVVPS